jgi:ribosomal 50S subunit-associated protein YjgA (DUF615 family)
MTTDSIQPVLERQHPDVEYEIRQDAGIYWQRTEQERQQRQQLAEKLRSLTPDQLNALGIDPTLLD